MVWLVTVLKKEEPLPGSQSCGASNHWNHLAGPGEHHPNVGRHIIRPFIGVDEIRSILGNKMIKKSMQIGARAGVCIFHNHQARTGMLHKNRNCSGYDARMKHQFFNLSGDFIRPLT